MDKYEKISLLLSIFEKLGLNKTELLENEELLKEKSDIEIEKLLENLWLLINKQKEYDITILKNIKKLNLNLEENIDKQKEKIENEKNINF